MQQQQQQQVLLICVGFATLALGEVGLPLEPNFENLQGVIPRAATRGDKLQVFQSIWGALRSDFVDDTDKAKGLYTQLGNFIRNEMACSSGPTGRSACELQQEVRRHLRMLMSQRLGNLLNAEENIQSYGMYIAASIEPALVRDILVSAVEDVYFHRPLGQLVRQLEQLYADRDEVSFKMMIEAVLALYWRSQNMHDDSNELFLFNVARVANRIATHHMYASVDADLRRRVSALQKGLPFVLQLLFDPEGFCLLSGSDREFLYTTITDDWNYGLNGRQVFAWRHSNYTDSAGVIRAFEQEPNAHTATATATDDTPVFTLRGELFKWYLYVDPAEGNRVGALRSGSPSSSTSFWTISYVDNVLIFRQRELTMCVAEIHDEERRRVKMLPGQLHTPPSRDCQWLAMPCT